eukprot:2078203-Amphidinium_carterae.1
MFEDSALGVVPSFPKVEHVVKFFVRVGASIGVPSFPKLWAESRTTCANNLQSWTVFKLVFRDVIQENCHARFALMPH